MWMPIGAKRMACARRGFLPSDVPGQQAMHRRRQAIVELGEVTW
jgi:hypothetical protein